MPYRPCARTSSSRSFAPPPPALAQEALPLEQPLEEALEDARFRTSTVSFCLPGAGAMQRTCGRTGGDGEGGYGEMAAHLDGDGATN